MKTIFIIKQFRLSNWFYYSQDEGWFFDPAMATEFETYQKAETFLNENYKGFKGFFKIEKVFVIGS